MRIVYVSLLSLIGLLNHPAWAERNFGSTIAIPTLGWVFDGQAQAIRPIVGTLGAAIVGPQIDAGFPVATASIASQQGFAIVVSAEDQRVRTVTLRHNESVVREVKAADTAPDRIVLSPSGTAALLYFSRAGRVQVITGLPLDAAVEHEFSLSDREITPTGWAVSDDGDRSLFVTGAGMTSSVRVLDANLGMYIASFEGSSFVMSFFPDSHKALVVNQSSEIFLLEEGTPSHLGRTAGQAAVNPVAIQFSQKRTRAYIAYADGNIVEFDPAIGVARTASCNCRITDLHGLNDPSLFRITELSASPLLLVNMADSEPRIWFVPSGRATNGRNEQ